MQACNQTMHAQKQVSIKLNEVNIFIIEDKRIMASGFTRANIISKI